MDRNILSFYIHVDYESGGSQGIGGLALDTYSHELNNRIGTAYGCHMIRSVLELFGVDDLSELKGRYTYVLFPDENSWGNLPIGIQPLVVDKGINKPFVFEDIRKMFEKELTKS